jgi:hypothetical protein
MKNKFKFATHSLMGLFLMMTLVLGACEKDDDKPNNEVQFQNIMLSGANERPTVVNSPGTGTFNGTYDRTAKTITYTITWSGTTTPVTAMHFHNAIPTANLPATAVSGNVVIGIPGTGTGTSATYTSPVTGTTRALTMDEETALLAGNWYVNLHTSQFPAGELRGQLMAQ